MNEKQVQTYEQENDGYAGNIELQKIKSEIHQKLLEVLDLNEARQIPIEQLHEQCCKRVDALLAAPRAEDTE